MWIDGSSNSSKQISLTAVPIVSHARPYEFAIEFECVFVFSSKMGAVSEIHYLTKCSPCKSNFWRFRILLLAYDDETNDIVEKLDRYFENVNLSLIFRTHISVSRSLIWQFQAHFSLLPPTIPRAPLFD